MQREEREWSKCTDAARLPFSIITLPYSCCEGSINSVVWIEGEGQAAKGEGGDAGRQRIDREWWGGWGVDLGQSRSLLPESQAAQMRLSGCLLPPWGQAALFVHPFYTKPSCLFTNHTVIFWLLLCLSLFLYAVMFAYVRHRHMLILSYRTPSCFHISHSVAC